MTFQLRQLLTIIGALHFHRVVRLFRGDDQAIVHGHGNHVSQVILTLRVVIGQPAHPVTQTAGRNGEDAGIAFSNGALGFSCILVLNNRTHLAGCVTHDAAVPGWIIQVDCEQAQLLRRYVLEQPLQRVDFNQRYVAVQDQDILCRQKG